MENLTKCRSDVLGTSFFRLDGKGWRPTQPLRRHHMAHGQRQLNAAVAECPLLAAAEILVAVPGMQVAVANAGGDGADQHLPASRFWPSLWATRASGFETRDLSSCALVSGS